MQDKSKKQSRLKTVTSHLPTKTLNKAQNSVLTVATCAAATAKLQLFGKQISGSVRRTARVYRYRPRQCYSHTRCKRSVSSTPGRFILYPSCPLKRWVGARHSRAGHFGQVKPLAPARIRTPDRPASNLITKLITTQLHLELRGGDKY